MSDIAVGNVGVDEEGLIHGEELFPLDLESRLVKIAIGVAIEGDQGRDDATGQSSGIGNAVECFRLAAKVDAAIAGLAIVSTQLLELTGYEFFQSSAALGEESRMLLIFEHGRNVADSQALCHPLFIQSLD